MDYILLSRYRLCTPVSLSRLIALINDRAEMNKPAPFPLCHDTTYTHIWGCF